MRILIDSREKKPWHFAGHQHFVATLQTGDYSLDGHATNGICIERKQDVAEIAGNLSDPEKLRRFSAEFLRMSTFRWRAVIICQPREAFIDASHRSKIPSGKLLARLDQLSMDHHVSFYWCDGHKAGGAIALHLLTLYSNNTMAKQNLDIMAELTGL